MSGCRFPGLELRNGLDLGDFGRRLRESISFGPSAQASLQGLGGTSPFQCPNCGAPLVMGAEDRVSVCQNCNTCVTNDRTIIKEHYLLPAHYSASEALERLTLWLKKQTGTDEELPVNIQIISSSLSFFPFWNVQVKAATSYTGIGRDASFYGPDGFNEFKHIERTQKAETGSFDRIFSFTYPAAPEIPSQLLSYEFPTRAKKYFGQSYAKEYGGKVLNGRITQPQAETRGRADSLSAMTSQIMREVNQITTRNDQVDISSSYYAHVPVWDIAYQFGKENYRAFVDASTGRVVFATYPVSLEYRVRMGAASAGHIALAAIVGFVLIGLSFPPLFPLVIGLGSVGAALGLAALRRGRAKEVSR